MTDMSNTRLDPSAQEVVDVLAEIQGLGDGTIPQTERERIMARKRALIDRIEPGFYDTHGGRTDSDDEPSRQRLEHFVAVEAHLARVDALQQNAPTGEGDPFAAVGSDSWMRAEAARRRERMSSWARGNLERIEQTSRVELDMLSGLAQMTLVSMCEFSFADGLVDLLVATADQASNDGYQAGHHDAQQAVEGRRYLRGTG